MEKTTYQAPALVEVGEFGELTAGFLGIFPDGGAFFVKRNDFTN
ncbi:lasso RiPP family leader peptide-containing protein [Crossiella sp. NPDC003009]